MKATMDKASEIVEKRVGINTFCNLGLIDTDGYPTVSTITASKASGIRDIYFCTGIGGNKTIRISGNSMASVCYNTEEYNITLVGDIEVLTDQKLKNELWYEGLANHFNGPNDPNYCVLHFRTKRYNLLVEWEECIGAF